MHSLKEDPHSRYEAEGCAAMGAAAFVLVAGGLGERLGYSGLKLALPTELATWTSYLEFYAKSILALGARCQVGYVVVVCVYLCISLSIYIYIR